MKIGPLVLMLLLALLAPAAPVRAQEPAECELLDNPTRSLQIRNRSTPSETWYVTDAEFVCPGGRVIVAETATYALATGQITLNGNVQVDDPDRALRSGFAQYFTETEQLHARTRVVLTEKRNGSVIMSELLDLYQETPQRPSLLVATGGRPRAILFQTPGDGPPAADAVVREAPAGGVQPRDSTVLDAREIRITGGDSFRGTGDAVMTRDSLTATGDAIEYSEVARRLDVMGSAVVKLPSQELRGDTITATVDAQDEIDDVLARHGASLRAEDLRVTAPAIRLLFADGGVERLIAMDWEPAPGVAQGARPHVESDLFSMDADSIDVLAPQQRITEAVAVGNARGERVIPDSLRALLPEAAPEVLALLSSDWMVGDTVRARFAPNPRAEVDTTADATVMEQLAAYGDQAQSMYSIRDDADPAAKLAFNYLLSSYIEVNFRDGEVSVVSAAGDSRGVYLQPADAARAASSSTVGAAPPPRR